MPVTVNEAFTSWSPAEPDTRVMNARWFGAKGNGVTDDAPALRRCMAAALAAGVPMYIPAGDYYLGSYVSTGSTGAFQQRAAIFVDNSAYTTPCLIYGDGPGTRLHWPGGSRFQKDGVTLLPWTFSNNYQQFVDPAYASITGYYCPFVIKGNNIAFRNLCVYGDNGTSTGTNYLQSENYQHAAIISFNDTGLDTYRYLTVEDCEFRNLFGFPHGSSAGSYYYIRWNRNKHYYCGNGVNPGGDYYDICDNEFVHAEGLELAGGYGIVSRNRLSGTTSVISMSGNGDSHSRRVTISDNIIDCTDNDTTRGGGSGIIIGGFEDVSVRGGSITNAPAIAILVALANGGSAPCKRVTIDGVNVYNTRTSGGFGTPAGIQISAGIQCVVRGCTVKGSASVQMGIELISTVNCTVSACTASNLTYGGILVISSCTGTLIEGCQLHDNTLYGLESQSANVGLTVSACHMSGNGTFDVKIDALPTKVRLLGNRWQTTSINPAGIVGNTDNGT